MTSTDPLRIGIVAPPWVPVPPAAYGGTELALDVLCRGLADLGHSVTLFTTGDATCPVGRAFVFDHSPPDHAGHLESCVLALRHVAAAYDALDGLDIVHDHTLAGLFLSQLHPVPAVTTVHLPFDPDLSDLYRRVGYSIPIIAVSHDQAARAPVGVPIDAVIHHGLDLAVYPFSPEGGDGLVFLGRMSPDKGIDDAILAARAVGRPLRIAAKVREPAEHEFYRDVIEPMLSSDVEFVGEVGLDEKIELLTSAAALVNPIRWPEPFGLVMVESLACGTPVVATRMGAVPEIVADGRTGTVAGDFDDLVAGLRYVDDLDREECRSSAERHFTMERMAREHEAFYRRVLHGTEPADPADAEIDLRTVRRLRTTPAARDAMRDQASSSGAG